MTALIIGDAERKAILGLKERAKGRVTVIAEGTTQEMLVNVGDQMRAANAPLTIELPTGYHVTYTLEDQPVGLIEHLSVSVRKKGKMPNPHAIEMILKEFGMKPLAERNSSIWIEEFEPGHEAINVAQLAAKGRN